MHSSPSIHNFFPQDTTNISAVANLEVKQGIITCFYGGFFYTIPFSLVNGLFTKQTSSKPIAKNSKTNSKSVQNRWIKKCNLSIASAFKIHIQISGSMEVYSVFVDNMAGQSFFTLEGAISPTGLDLLSQNIFQLHNTTPISLPQNSLF
jgi:hypothetical protein